MRAVVQRVAEAAVKTDGKERASIGPGLLVLIGIARDDADGDIRYITEKCLDLRIFEDREGVMNRSARELDLPLLIVSQFTLYGDARKGRRPSYYAAAPPEAARPVYERVCDRFRSSHTHVQFGVFGADMQVSLVNDGPVTILLDSRKEF